MVRLTIKSEEHIMPKLAETSILKVTILLDFHPNSWFSNYSLDGVDEMGGP